MPDFGFDIDVWFDIGPSLLIGVVLYSFQQISTQSDRNTETQWTDKNPRSSGAGCGICVAGNLALQRRYKIVNFASALSKLSKTS